MLDFSRGAIAPSYQQATSACAYYSFFEIYAIAELQSKAQLS